MSLVARFQLKTDGTGATIGTPVKLGFDDDDSNDLAPATFELKCEGPLIRAIVNTYYFGAVAAIGNEDTEFSIRQAAQRHVDAVATSLNYRPYTVKELARGKAVIPHIHQGWGDLQMDTYMGGVLPSTYDVILANCTLESVEIVDDPNLIGIAVRFTFVATRDSVSPAA